MAAVVADSLKTTFLDILGNAVTADYMIQSDTSGGPDDHRAHQRERPGRRCVIGEDDRAVKSRRRKAASCGP